MDKKVQLDIEKDRGGVMLVIVLVRGINYERRENRGTQVRRNDDGLLKVSDDDKNIAWKSDHEKLFNKEFAWDTYSLSQAFTVSSVPHFIDKDMVSESLSKMKNGKAAGPSGN